MFLYSAALSSVFFFHFVCFQTNIFSGEKKARKDLAHKDFLRLARRPVGFFYTKLWGALQGAPANLCVWVLFFLPRYPGAGCRVPGRGRQVPGAGRRVPVARVLGARGRVPGVGGRTNGRKKLITYRPNKLDKPNRATRPN